MENNTDNKPKRPPGLIRQPRVIPNNLETKEERTEDKVSPIKSEPAASKKVNINQQRNIKVSNETKKQIDILLKFANHKFTYELIESMIDVYVEHALDHDQKRAFKTLSKMLSE